MDELTTFLMRHKLVALQFSAGKDSAAVLKLARPFLSRVIVMWVNPGHAYPEVLDYMLHVARSVPWFQTVAGHQREWVRDHGHPVDVMPFEATDIGRIASRGTAPRLVPLEQCCSANMWMPLYDAMKHAGVTGVIRGEKDVDELRSPMRSGMKRDGFEFFFPLEHWTDAQVIEYLGDDIPASYKRGLSSSLDCMSCTAYLAHNPGRLADLREHHPREWNEIEPVITWMREAAREHLQTMEAQPSTTERNAP